MTVKWVFMPASGGDSVGMAQRADKTNGWGESEGRTLRLTQRKYHGGWGGGGGYNQILRRRKFCLLYD